MCILGPCNAPVVGEDDGQKLPREVEVASTVTIAATDSGMVPHSSWFEYISLQKAKGG